MWCSVLPLSVLLCYHAYHTGDGCSGIADPAEACLSKRLSSPFASTTPPQTPTPPSSTRVPSPVPLVPIDSDQFSVVSGSTGPADLVGLHAGHRDGNEEPDGCSSSDAASDAAAGAPGRVAVGHVSTKGGQGGPARAAASPTKTEPTTIQTCVMMVGGDVLTWLGERCYDRPCEYTRRGCAALCMSWLFCFRSSHALGVFPQCST